MRTPYADGLLIHKPSGDFKSVRGWSVCGIHIECGHSRAKSIIKFIVHLVVCSQKWAVSPMLNQMKLNRVIIYMVHLVVYKHSLTMVQLKVNVNCLMLLLYLPVGLVILKI